MVGAIGGLNQYSIKRMLIYSGLSNAAFLMSFFLTSMFENDHSFLMYIFLYLSVMISIFLSLF
jgi:NADH:ubiquinone oxidoreductase subunit 2 (subunit N)